MTDAEALVIVRARRGTMYDPAVVDVFERVCGEITPTSLNAPQLQKALQQISRAAEPAPVPAVPEAPAGDSPDAMITLVNLARIVGGQASVADVASIAWNHIRPLVPGASCALFLVDTATDSVVARFVAGDAAPALQGLTMKVGDRLSGWVAGHHQPIVNSDAQLDLGPEASLMGLRHCLAMPLPDAGGVVAVLSVYAAEPFRDDQARMLQVVAPHLGHMLASVGRNRETAEPSPVPAPARLRVIARG